MKKKKERTHEEEIADRRVEIGNGSIYEQLDYKDYKEMETKSILVMEINAAIKKKKLTQTKCAKIIGISQPKLSELLNGHFRGYSVERLMHFLNELGKDVDIIIRPKLKHHRASVNVYHSNTGRSSRASITAKGKM